MLKSPANDRALHHVFLLFLLLPSSIPLSLFRVRVSFGSLVTTNELGKGSERKGTCGRGQEDRAANGSWNSKHGVEHSVEHSVEHTSGTKQSQSTNGEGEERRDNYGNGPRSKIGRGTRSKEEKHIRAVTDHCAAHFSLISGSIHVHERPWAIANSQKLPVPTNYKDISNPMSLFSTLCKVRRPK